jgi:hypothetical protein
MSCTSDKSLDELAEASSFSEWMDTTVLNVNTNACDVSFALTLRFDLCMKKKKE